ncbi:unnamed protein product [Onchocerca flexuosa]|uniref:Ovule protein n=1 Tax=Onchocerca flexuosa TaxID=387005 RepID=A0A183HVN9_9BILA|nr:unnamed protein product [Onchocerca flexuosa]
MFLWKKPIRLIQIVPSQDTYEFVPKVREWHFRLVIRWHISLNWGKLFFCIQLVYSFEIYSTRNNVRFISLWYI